MSISRRDALKLLGACVASGSIDVYALAGVKPSAPRMPLEEFVQDDALLKGLRRGVQAMQKRKQSDPLSWFYQASMHGVTPQAVADAADADSGVAAVFQKRYWNQCPHHGENSANFLPWHRAHTYHFEKVLRMHTELDSFSLPYWNYNDCNKPDNRKFPREFGVQYLDGNANNADPANINPLYYESRDFYFCKYEHPFALNLPLLALSDGAVDIRLPMAAEVFFGETETDGIGGGIADEDPTTRGLIESYPHDQIHRAVGGIVTGTDGDGKPVTAYGAMAQPPTAAFDPIFPFHHSNVDRLWAVWSCLPGKRWGKLPSAYWFNERPWFFYDTDGRVVNEPRKAYFDYRALGVRFRYEDERRKPLALPDVERAIVADAAARVRQIELLHQRRVAITALPASRAVVPVEKAAKEKLQAPARALRAEAPARGAEARILLRLTEASLGHVRGTGFDVHLTDKPGARFSRDDPSFVGSVSMFRHDAAAGAGGMMHGGAAAGVSETFDVTRAVAAVRNEALEGLSVVIVPYSLLETPAKGTVILNNREALKVGGLEFYRVEFR